MVKLWVLTYHHTVVYSLHPVYFWDKLCSGNLAYHLVLILKSLPVWGFCWTTAAGTNAQLPSFLLQLVIRSGEVKLVVQYWLTPLILWCPHEKASTKKETRSQIIWRSSSGHKETSLHVAQGVLVQRCSPACHQELRTYNAISTGCFVSHSFYCQERSHLPLSLQKELLTCKENDNFSPLKSAYETNASVCCPWALRIHKASSILDPLSS